MTIGAERHNCVVSIRVTPVQKKGLLKLSRRKGLSNLLRPIIERLLSQGTTP